ncbi:MAG: NAD-dependent epimerase/dehydratase family protein [Deferribacteraceae bacterium]|jgi:UDP-glucuronate decarboxylase|nr:NAD-dependent epimerase/dehydratase family protein [Deferribacteraceae bacterium]
MNSIVNSDLEHITQKFGDINRFDGKVILITGFAGFLGYYFTLFFNYLSTKGVNIKKLILCDNFLLGRPDWIDSLKEPNTLIEDFNITSDLGGYSYLGEADYIIHMASIASPVFYRKYPLETIEANILGLRNLLEVYKNRNIDGFLFFSSSEIYGDPDPKAVPIDEEYLGNVSCIGPRSCYDEAKRFGETLSYYYSRIYNIPIGVARPFNNFGPGMKLNDTRVPADFAKAVLNNEDIIILSDGLPKRTFCYIADAICGYLKILTYGKYDYFNIGTESPEISIREFADMYKNIAAKLFGYNGEVKFKVSSDSEYLTNNPNRRCPKIDKARRLLGYEPKISVESGIERFLRFLSEENRG